MKIFMDDYYTIVAKTKKQAKEYYKGLGETGEFEFEEVDGGIEKVHFPLDKLPDQYQDEAKYPRQDSYGYVSVEITLNEAMKFSKEETPYMLAFSSEFC